MHKMECSWVKGTIKGTTDCLVFREGGYSAAESRWFQLGEREIGERRESWMNNDL